MTDAAVYEPWRPTVGQRVRVRLNGECRTEIHEAAPPPSVSDDVLRAMMVAGVDVATRFARNGVMVGHPEQFEGAVGVVTAIYHDEVVRGHFYRVMFDAAIEPGAYLGADLAAAELIPLTDDGGADRD